MKGFDFMNRKSTKLEIRKKIAGNIGPVIQGTIIISLISLFFSRMDSENMINVYGVLLLIAVTLTQCLGFLGLELNRGKNYSELEVKDNFTWINSASDFIDLVFLNFLMGVFIFFWTLLFFIPGIIKAYSYSQAQFIFFEKKRAGTPISYSQAITQSRHMMNGLKMDLFVLDLSFIGWDVLGIAVPTVIVMFAYMLFIPLVLTISFITIPIAWFALVYKQFTRAAFYDFYKDRVE